MFFYALKLISGLKLSLLSGRYPYHTAPSKQTCQIIAFKRVMNSSETQLKNTSLPVSDEPLFLF